jgi:hypothetical protein
VPTSVFLHYIGLINVIEHVSFWVFMVVIINKIALLVLNCVEFKYSDSSEECTASALAVIELCQVDAEESQR